MVGLDEDDMNIPEPLSTKPEKKDAQIHNFTLVYSLPSQVDKVEIQHV